MGATAITSVSQCDKLISDYTAEANILLKKTTNYEKQNSANKAKMEEATKQINTYREKINQIQDQLTNDIEFRKKSLKEAYDKTVADGNPNKSLLNAILELDKEAAKLYDQIDSYKAEINKQQKKKDQYKQRIAANNGYIKNAKAELKRINKEIGDLRALKKKLKSKKSGNDHKDWQKCPHYKKGEWNVVSFASKTCTSSTFALQKAHNTWSKGYSGKWGAVTNSVYNKIKASSTSKKNSAKPSGSLYAHVTKYTVVKITKRISEGDWTTKTVKFWYIPTLKRWCIEKTPDTNTVILKLVNRAIDSDGSNGDGTPTEIGDEVMEPSEGYVEDHITAGEYEDDTDFSDKDFPNGLTAHSVSSFIKKVNGTNKSGYGHKHYDEEKEYGKSSANEYGARINSNSDFKHLVRSRGIWNQDIHKWAYQYNRMQWANPDYGIGSTREYLFFTKPDLGILNRSTGNLVKALGNDPFWTEMFNKYRDIIQMLQYSAPKVKNSSSWMAQSARYVKRKEFITLLTNAVSGALDLPSSSADTTETGSTIYGTNIQYRKGAWKSDEGYDFSLEFVDSPYLQVYHLFKMWEEYTKLKDIGAINPPGPRNCNPYRTNKVLHDQIGIFKFIVGEDMETIQYYAYLTGCFPKSVPRDSFNNVNAGQISYSIDWHAQFVEDMNPLILIHFNNIMRKELGCKLTGSSSNALNMGTGQVGFGKHPGGIIDSSNYKYVPVYNHKYGHINGGFRSYPIIGIVNDNNKPGRYKYVLRWYDPA